MPTRDRPRSGARGQPRGQTSSAARARRAALTFRRGVPPCGGPASASAARRAVRRRPRPQPVASGSPGSGQRCRRAAACSGRPMWPPPLPCQRRALQPCSPPRLRSPAPTLVPLEAGLCHRQGNHPWPLRHCPLLKRTWRPRPPTTTQSGPGFWWSRTAASHGRSLTADHMPRTQPSVRRQRRRRRRRGGAGRPSWRRQSGGAGRPRRRRSGGGGERRRRRRSASGSASSSWRGRGWSEKDGKQKRGPAWRRRRG
mmetsp:Transcript_70899/g.223931  ORF Transcript_70899/g.223931 Transcript_70899/m.223931 type:complete len:255 (-) Transcript_70899:961-1725(-)